MSTKITDLYHAAVDDLNALTPVDDDFESHLEEIISLLIKIKFAYHQRDIKQDGSIDWSATNHFLNQVEAGMHRYGIVPGWQERLQPEGARVASPAVQPAVQPLEAA